VKFSKDKIYFGDFKPENLLVSFSGRIVLLGDFGCSMKMKSGDNYVKGGTRGWCLPLIV